MKQYQGISLTCSTFLSLLVTLAALTANPAYAAVAAGKVLFTAGQTQAIETSGNRRNLRRGDEIFSGDRLQTGSRSRLQVSLTDGAYISVQPDSEYEIEEYQFSGSADGTEKSYFQLLKGGIRAITGLIGRKNKDAYRVNTAVATIGIRGTGHHTRMCQGDCQGKEDGLYHYTTKGTTYAKNDVDSRDVPKNRGVFVKDRRSRIQFFDEPPVETAAQLGEDNKEEEEDKDERGKDTFFAGEQRDNETGDQIVFDTLNVSTVKPLGVNPNGGFFDDGYALVAASHDDEDSLDPVDVTLGYNTSFFFDADGNPIGAILTDGESSTRSFGTIDLRAVLGGDDPAVVSEVESLVAMADPLLVGQLAQNPASVLEFTTFNEIFWFRWGDGNFLSFNTDLGFFETVLDEFTGHQSLHVIAGPEPASVPSVGSAYYDFVGGTQSTSVSGATTGLGVTSGFLSVSFNSGQGFLDMDVTHNNIDYFISGNLLVNPSENEIFDQFFNVFASTSAAGSACNPDCPVQVDGGFAGPEFEFDLELFPKYIGLQYDIEETDVILGVAAFKLDDSSIQTLLNSTLTGISIRPGVSPIQMAEVTVSGNPVVNVSSNLSRIGFAPTGASFSLNNDSATAFETFNDGTLFISRWSGGNVTDIFGGSPTVNSLNSDQGVHIVLGLPTSPVPTTGTATYQFIPGSATLTTHVSGSDTPDGGINSGSIQIDFLSALAFPNFTLEHDGDIFTVTQPSGLPFQSLTSGASTQRGFFGFATASSAVICSSPCGVELGGTFAGNTSSPIGNIPAELGVVYQVFTGDPFTGAGGFGLSATAP